MTLVRLGAQSYEFTFENLPSGVATPLIAVTPETGGAGLTATFTTAPLADYLGIDNFNTPSLISGQALMWRNAYATDGTPPSELTITFSRPVLSLSLTLEIIAGASGVTATADNGDMVVLTAPSTYDMGTVAVPINPGLPTFYVNLASGTEFSQITFTLTGTGGTLAFFMFDNLAVTAAPSAVPEPASTAMLAGGMVLAGVIGWRRWHRKTG